MSGFHVDLEEGDVVLHVGGLDLPVAALELTLVRDSRHLGRFVSLQLRHQ